MVMVNFFSFGNCLQLVRGTNFSCKEITIVHCPNYCCSYLDPSSRIVPSVTPAKYDNQARLPDFLTILFIYKYTSSNIWLNVPLLIASRLNAFGSHQKASEVQTLGMPFQKLSRAASKKNCRFRDQFQQRYSAKVWKKTQTVTLSLRLKPAMNWNLLEH